jgi:hypothetical protein
MTFRELRAAARLTILRLHGRAGLLSVLLLHTDIGVQLPVVMVAQE